ncbi:hypothetical protein BUZ37_01655 [Staphylococcus haemolyticus]|uniref:hypothetical protein n=1 Tax=Staphylococcus haemolyticus TaxID=1283 RepID=UPI000D1FBD67|nr:hypothetical protein [Staphylococcus haemolyticus]PTK55261.1 hypothetical protein BUZ37_01655 [Staphylococcus haemolyticus]PTK62755.1 hypothetical protein BUZ36_02220 [Staphylococcus haemolyticus]
MIWQLFLIYKNGKYEIIQAGSNMVPVEPFDKVIPTTEKIARQSDKVYFDGEKLKLKDGEKLLSVEELNELKESPLEEPKQTQPVIFDIE